MDIQNLKDVFQKFAVDHNRAILVDGAWGIGKTYYVLQFLKEFKQTKNKQKIAYVSLFGKSSIDEVHTEIYSRLHPVKQNSKRIIQIIPKVAPLLGAVGDIVSSLEFALKDGESISGTQTTDAKENQTTDAKDNQITDESEGNKAQEIMSAVVELAEHVAEFDHETEKLKARNSSQKRNIIILDDLERMNCDKISFTDVLGYINNLFLQNFKVIMICNSKEIDNKKSTDFISFKEKVFDREYFITSTNREVINSYFSGRTESLKEYIVSEFGDNLRIAHRVSSFYVEAIQVIKSILPSYEEKVTDESILFGCTLIVVACNTTKYDREGNDKEKENLTEVMLTASMGLDETSRKKIRNINKYVSKKQLGGVHTQLLAGLLLLYYHNSKEGLNRVLGEQERNQNPLLEEAFYFSDADKEKLFDEQFEYIVEADQLQGGNVFQAVRSMCKYKEYSRIDEREDEIIHHVLQKCEEKDVNFLVGAGGYGEEINSRFEEFRKSLKKAQFEMLIKVICSELKRLYMCQKYPVIVNKLNLLSSDSTYFAYEKGQRVFADEVMDTFRDCNYFIEDLFGNISAPQWEVAHRICDLANEYGFSQEVVDFILSMDFNDDRSAKQRYEILLEKMSNHDD